MNWTQQQLDQYLGKGGEAEVLSGNGDSRPKEAKMPLARARLKTAEPNFRSKTERRAWENYRRWIPEPYLSRLVRMLFEPFVFHLAGGNYTPDFMLVFDDGEMWFIEVKGSHGMLISQGGQVKEICTRLRPSSVGMPDSLHYYQKAMCGGSWMSLQIVDGGRKMAVVWLEAPKEVLAVVEEMRNKYHPNLVEAEIGVIMREEAPLKSGKLVYGQAMKPPEKWKTLFVEPYDFVIWFAKDVWEGMLNSAQQKALADHELCHCSMLDGPSIRPHDVEEFAAVIARHGLWDQALMEMAQAMEQYKLPFTEKKGRVKAVPAGVGKVFEPA